MVPAMGILLSLILVAAIGIGMMGIVCKVLIVNTIVLSKLLLVVFRGRRVLVSVLKPAMLQVSMKIAHNPI